jgi:aspartate/methionine/tyrosine aminotransferase
MLPRGARDAGSRRRRRSSWTVLRHVQAHDHDGERQSHHRGQYPDFRFHADRFDRAITKKTKLLILSSPAQSDGCGPERSRHPECAVEIAKKYDLLIISDEIYEPFLMT